MDEAKAREIKVVTLDEKILGENDFHAEENRALLRQGGIYTINLLSAPGSGKTALLVKTLELLKGRIRCGVIEGDQQTSIDAARIAETGVPVVQINTGNSCHLNAVLVRKALKDLPLHDLDVLFIENVGNLICPAAFDLGEDEKVALMSVTEGEDKPRKYPLLFSLARVVLLTKMDLLPYVPFSLKACRQALSGINPKARIIETSAINNLGLVQWLDYVTGKSRHEQLLQ